MAGSSAVYGMEQQSVWNVFGEGTPVIPTQDALEQFKINYSDANNYNNAVEAFKYARMQSALDTFVENETMDAAMNMHMAVDAFVDASVAVAEVVRVSEVATEVQTMKETDEAAAVQLGTELQEYVQTNDVSLTDAELTEYNDSLDMVETAVATFAAFAAVGASPEMKQALQERMDAAEAFADESASVSFDYTQSGAAVTFQFATAQNNVAEAFTVDVSAYLSTLQNAEFFDSNASGDYSMAISSDCASNLAAPIGSCLSRSRMGPPPNVLLYDSTDGGNTFFVFAYTDESGNIIEFMDGDIVIDPQTGQQIGTYTSNGLVCDAGYEGYCNG